MSSKPSELLISGFVRKVETQLADDQIIPHSAITLCWRFYYLKALLFFLQHSPNHLHIGNISADHKVHIPPVQIEINNSKIAETFLSGRCITSKFSLFPSRLTNRVNPLSTKVIFKVGGNDTNSESHALIIDTDDFSIYNMELPIVRKNYYGNSIAFSQTNQALFSVGGNYFEDKAVRVFFFEDQYDANNWCWETIANMPATRHNCSSIVIDEYDKLMIVGGRCPPRVATNEVLIYDLEKEEWQKNVAKNRIARRAAGICWNKWNEQIYIGGGIDGKDNGKSVEYYDLHENKWKSLPDTKFAHKLHPAMWIEDNVMLHIASFSENKGPSFNKSSNSVECIDLRVCDKWNTLVADNILSNVFGIKKMNSFVNCCLFAV